MWRQEQKAFPRGVAIGILLTLVINGSLSFVPDPERLRTAAFALLGSMVLVSFGMYPLGIYYRKLKEDAYTGTLIKSTIWTFTAFQVLYVLTGQKPLWSLFLSG